MNPLLEEAKKNLRAAVIAYVCAAYKASGSVEIAGIMLAKQFTVIGESLTEADFEGLDDEKDSEK